MSGAHRRATVVCAAAEREGKSRVIGWAWAQVVLLDEDKKLRMNHLELYRKAVSMSSGTGEPREKRTHQLGGLPRQAVPSASRSSGEVHQGDRARAWLGRGHVRSPTRLTERPRARSSSCTPTATPAGRRPSSGASIGTPAGDPRPRMTSLRNLGGLGFRRQSRSRLGRGRGQRGRVEERFHLELSNGFTDIHVSPLLGGLFLNTKPRPRFREATPGHPSLHQARDNHMRTLVALGPVKK